MNLLREHPRLVALGLGVQWLSVQVSLFFFGPRPSEVTPHFGVRFGNDSKRFLEGAESLLNGLLPAGKAIRYLGYDCFVATFLGSGLGLFGVVLAQVLLTSVAAYCLYRLACRLFDHRTGLLGAFLYIGYAEIHIWNFYILAESLFVSMVIISLYLVVTWRGWWRVTIAALVILFSSTIRPNGVILALPVGMYVLYSLFKARRHYVFLGAVGVFLVSVPIAIKLINAMLVYTPVLKYYARGTVIVNHQPSALMMTGVLPEHLTHIKNPLLGILFFIAAKPVYFLQLAGMKLWYFFLHIRPFYSDFHNYISLLVLVPSYALALVGMFSRCEYPSGMILLVSVCIFQSLVVAMTFADWDGRFLLVVLPIIFVFAARGAWSALDAARNWMNGIYMRKISPK